MATKGDVISAVMADVGDRTTDTAAKALHRVWFDESLEAILARWPWPYRRGLGTIDVIAAGFESFEVPATVAEIRFLRDEATRQPLEHIDYDRLLEAEVDLTETGLPRKWYWSGYDAEQNLQLGGLWPLPTDDMTLQYDATLQPPTPLADGDEIPAPNEVLAILKDFMRAKSYENESQTELMQSTYARGYERLERLVGSRGASRPEKRRRLREDGDLRNLRDRGGWSRIGQIPDPDA